jgi:hypothetical protein
VAPIYSYMATIDRIQIFAIILIFTKPG